VKSAATSRARARAPSSNQASTVPFTSCGSVAAAVAACQRVVSVALRGDVGCIGIAAQVGAERAADCLPAFHAACRLPRCLGRPRPARRSPASWPRRGVSPRQRGGARRALLARRGQPGSGGFRPSARSTEPRWPAPRLLRAAAASARGEALGYGWYRVTSLGRRVVEALLDRVEVGPLRGLRVSAPAPQRLQAPHVRRGEQGGGKAPAAPPAGRPVAAAIAWHLEHAVDCLLDVALGTPPAYDSHRVSRPNAHSRFPLACARAIWPRTWEEGPTCYGAPQAQQRDRSA
jgi:hypothetical protein